MHTHPRLLRLLTLAALAACSPSPWLGPFVVPPDGATRAPDAEALADADAPASDTFGPTVFARADARGPVRLGFLADASAPADAPVGEDAPPAPPPDAQEPVDAQAEDHTPPDVPPLDEDAPSDPDAGALAPDVQGDAQDAVAAPDAVAEDRPAVDAGAPPVDAPAAPDVAPAADVQTPPEDRPAPDTGPMCPTDQQTVCGGVCADLRSDVRHCGGCGRACRAGDACAEGMCRGFRGAFSVNLAPYRNDPDLARVQRGLDTECAMRVPGTRVCTRSESEYATRAACAVATEVLLAWITRDSLEWLPVGSEVATSLWICRSQSHQASVATMSATRLLACCE